MSPVSLQDRLLPAGQIDDRQAAHAEADAGQRDAALFVGSAMVQHPHHAREVARRRPGGSDHDSTMPTIPHMIRLQAELGFTGSAGIPSIARHLRGNAGGDRELGNLADHDRAGADDRIAADASIRR